jgi:hypothetical protein
MTLTLALAAVAAAVTFLAATHTATAQIRRTNPITPADAWNPKPADDDFVLPMPCNLSMAFRPIFILGRGYLTERHVI